MKLITDTPGTLAEIVFMNTVNMSLALHAGQITAEKGQEILANSIVTELKDRDVADEDITSESMKIDGEIQNMPLHKVRKCFKRIAVAHGMRKAQEDKFVMMLEKYYKMGAFNQAVLCAVEK